MDEEVLVEVDGRRRVSLGKLAEHDRYLVRAEPGGTLVFTPASVVALHDLRLQQRPDLLERFEENRRDPSRLVKRRRRHKAPGGNARTTKDAATA